MSRWIRFSVRGLFLAIATAGIALGLWTNSARRQERSVAIIREFGGKPIFEHTGTGSVPGPEWLRETLGAHYFVKLSGFDISNRRGKRFTDADLVELTRGTRLHRLSVYGSDVTDAGLIALASQDGLTWLGLDGTKVTDTGVKALKPSVLLTGLCLAKLPITDDGIQAVNKFPNLEMLHIGGTKITDEGLKAVGQLTKLRHLEAWGTSITDDGLRELIDLKALEVLNLENSRVTPTGVRTLQQALPSCRIFPLAVPNPTTKISSDVESTGAL